MNIKYVFALDVSPAQAWKVLMDIPALTPCMPGASLEGEDEKGYKGKMKVKLGPIDMVFNGHIRFLERDDTQQRALLEAAATETKGAGSAKASITFFVRPLDGGSEVTVDSDYAVNGKAAQFGGGVIQSVGKRLMDEFAKRVRILIAERAAVAEVSGQDGPDAAGQAGQQGPAADAPNESLDLLGLAWKPVLIRVALAVLVVAAGCGIWRAIG